MPIIKSPVPVDGNSIRVVRVFCGLSRRQLSQRSGVKSQRIFHIEHGITTPTADEISRLLGAMSTGSIEG